MARSLLDALRLASKDPAFAHDFVSNPEDYQQLYGLSDAQIREIRNARPSDITGHLETMARAKSGSGGGGGGDYY